MKTGLESLDTGASKITYRGNEGPKAPQQMAMADPMLVEQYQQYVFEMEEQGLQPMSFEEFVAQARAGMAGGGIMDSKYNIENRRQYFSGAYGQGAGDRGGDPRGSREENVAAGRTDAGNIQRAEEYRRQQSQTTSPPTTPTTGGPPGGGDPEMFYSPDYDEDPGTKIDPTIKPTTSTLDKIKELGGGVFKYIVDNTSRKHTPYYIRNVLDKHIKKMGYNNPVLQGYEEDDPFVKQALIDIELAKEGKLKTSDFEKRYMPEYQLAIRYPERYPEYNIGKGDGPGITSQYPYPMSTAMAPTAVTPETAVATAPANPFLPATNLPFANYGTAAHGAQFGVDPRMFVADGGRIGYAGGGIADLRQGYFLGKLVKKIGKGIKKVIKSPIGKAALLAAPFAFKGKTGIGNIIKNALFGTMKYGHPTEAGVRTGGLLDFLKTGKGAMTGIAALSSLPLIFGESQEEDEKNYYADASNIFDRVGSPNELRARALAGTLPQDQFPFQQYYAADGGRVGLMNGGDLRAAALNQLYGINDDEDKKLSKGGSAGLPPITAGIEGQASQSFSDDETPMPTQPDQMPKPMPNPMMMAGRMSPMMMAGRMSPMMKGMMPRMMAQEGGLMASKILGDESDDISMELYGKPVKDLSPGQLEDLIEYLDSLSKDFVSAPSLMARPRVMAQEGGLMDMGGMEKDYRNEGGFVPIGGQERADDVPARLSKNEFVFTADAVRNAGGGDIDKGAEVMENMMENLEKGGKVSEESQGLKGARDMFATAQRLEGVL